VLAGDRFCTTCGATVPARRARTAAAPATKQTPSRANTAAGTAAKPETTAAKPETPAAKPETPAAKPETPSAEPETAESAPTRARIGAWIALAVGIAVAIVGVVVVVALGRDSDDDPTGLGDGSGFATACDGEAQQEIALGSEETTVYGLLCFTVSQHSEITLGATPTGSFVDLRVWVSMATGEVVAENDDANGLDPEVVFEAWPGTYFVSVSRYEGGDPGPVTIRSSVVPLEGPLAATIPSASDCEELSGATMMGSGTATRADGEPFTCLTVGSPSFAKIGAIADDPATMDLTIAVYRFDESGTPEFVRSVDDTFWTDPELNLDLGEGAYVVEVASRAGGEVGAYSLYVDTTETYFRTGAVSSALATLRPGSCATLSALIVGTPLPFDAQESPLACLTLGASERLVIMAATAASQDLTLEIAGFDASGAPVRYVWADDDVFGEDIDSQDPRIDLVLPAGSYVLAVAEYWGEETPHDFVLTATAVAGD
jgi:hypothetical protein